jgi:hypothetical protein
MLHHTQSPWTPCHHSSLLSVTVGARSWAFKA